MKYLSQLLPPFTRKKRNVINGTDRLKLVPADAKNIGDADKEYNTVDDIVTYTNQQLVASNGIYNDNGEIKLGETSLSENTIIDTNGNNFAIVNGTFELLTGEIVPGTQGIQFKNNISSDEFVSVNVSDAGDSQMVYINTNLSTAYRVGVESGSASLLYIPDIINPGVGIIGVTVLDNQIIASGLQNFADDVAAAAGGISINGMYHTAGVLKIRLT